MKPLSLRTARETSAMTAEKIAQSLGVSRSQLYRIESGQCQPQRELARKIYRFYAGRVPLAAIYDPQFVSGMTATGAVETAQA